MEVFMESVQASSDHHVSSKNLDTSVTEETKEKNIRIISPSRETE